MQRKKTKLEKFTDQINAGDSDYLEARTANNRNKAKEARNKKKTKKIGKYSRSKSPKVPSIKKSV